MRILRDSVRGWMRTPGTALVASGGLALALAAVTSFFSIVDHLVLRTIAIERPNELHVLSDEERAGRYRYVTYPVWREIQARSHLYSSAAAWVGDTVDLAPAGRSEPAEAVWASGDIFQTLGVRMALGRPFDAADDRPATPNGAVAVVSHAFWRGRFGGAADVIGRTLHVDGVPVTVVGVTAPSFTAFELGARFDVVMPIAVEALVHRDFNFLNSPFRTGLRVLLRLRPGATAGSTSAAFRLEQPAIRTASVPKFRRPEERERFLTSPWFVRTAPDGASGVSAYYGRAVTVALALAGVVLIAACGNVALVLVAHATRRKAELAMRRVLGASRWTLARHAVMDALVLVGAGVLPGLALAALLTPVVVEGMAAIGFALDVGPTLNLRAVGLVGAVALVAGLVASVIPALASTRLDPIDATRGTSPRFSALTRAEPVLVGLQLAFAMVVVSVGGLFLASYRALVMTPTGVAPANVIIAQLNLDRLGPDHEALRSLLIRAREGVGRVPGVEAVATAMTVPFERGFANTIIDIPGAPARPESDRFVQVNWVSPSYFDVMGVKMLSGRALDDRDQEGRTRVAVVSRAFIDKYFGGNLSVPKTIVIPEDDGRREPIDVVGVSDDVLYKTLKEPALPGLHLAEAQQPDLTTPRGTGRVLVRIAGDRAAAEPAVSAALGAAAPGLTFSLQPFAWYVAREAARERVLAVVAGAFVIVSSVLAAIGVFGVATAAVTRRRRELGIRLALGALPRQVGRMLVAQAAKTALIGTAAGALVSWWASQFVSSLLVRTNAQSPSVVVAAAGVLAGVALVAAWWPARQAANLDPAVVLRVAE